MHAKKNYSAKSSAGGTAMVTEVNCPVSEAMVPWWKSSTAQTAQNYKIHSEITACRGTTSQWKYRGTTCR